MKEFFKPFTVTIPAGGVHTITAYSNFLTLLSNSSATAIKIGLGNNAAEADMIQGLSIELPQNEAFNNINLFNPSLAAMTISLVLSYGRVYDNRIVISSVVNVRDVANSTPSGSQAVNDAAVEITAVAGQKCIELQNAGAESVWIGDNTITAAKGIEIKPGDVKAHPVSCSTWAVCGAGKNSILTFNKYAFN